MPKKTGSQSLVGVCEGIAAVEGDWHGDTWLGCGARYMVVRHPINRLVSMYRYIKAGNGDFAHGPGGFEEWVVRYFAIGRKPGNKEWWQTQSQIAESFQPERVFRLEDGLVNVLGVIGIQKEMQWRNVTVLKGEAGLAVLDILAELPASSLRMIDDWAGPDKERWYA